MEKKLFYIWLCFAAMLFSVNINAQASIGSKKNPEAFSVLELANIGGLRLPQMTTAQRNAFAVKGNALGNGLTIYNSTTGCVEYWNSSRWVSLCDGTSQTTISPTPCIGVAADGSGCNQTFTVADVDCPTGPFTITIVAGGDYAALYDVDNVGGSFKVAFNENANVNARTILVRVTSTCTSMYKEFLFSQNGVNCTSMSYAVPTISPASTNLSLCAGGSAYLAVPATTANLDKLIWTRNGVEVARGVSFYIANLAGKYNVSMGAVGCNTNAANERNVTTSATAASGATSIIASNNGVLCGSNPVTLTATGNTANVVWLQNGVEKQSGATISLTGDSSVGEWFAAIKDGSCYSKPSNSITITKSAATGQVTLNDSDALVNGKALSTFNSFCAGGSLDLSVANQKNGITYTWYNGNDIISSNPFIVPTNLTKITLRLVATDNSGATCSKEVNVVDKSVTTGGAPAQPNITGNSVLCAGTTDLTLVPAVAGTYTYTWYKDGIKMAQTTPTITVTTPGVVYTGMVTTQAGCSSTVATKTIAANVSDLPVLTWVSKPPSGNYGTSVSLQTAIEFGPAVSYTWTADSGAVVTGSGESASVKLPASGTSGATLTVKVTAVNSCGKSVEIAATITMNNACPQPVLTAQSDLSQTVTAGSSAVVSVSVSSAVNETYQWYSNATASTTGGTKVGTSSKTYTYTPSGAGTTYFYCIVTNGCTGNPTGTSSVFTVTANANPATLPTGAGTLSGKTCFDITESNDGGSCGLLTSRASTKADFNQTATNTQTYTFTPSGAVSKIRFAYVESLGGTIVKSLTNNGSESALNVTATVTATMVYKNTLSSTNGAGTGAAFGKTTANALSVDLYVIYNDNAAGTGTDKTVKLTAKIQDCACCGAFVAPSVWKNFMCYNLGANESLDPMVPNPGLIGNYYMRDFKEPFANASALVPPPTVTPWNGNPRTVGDPCPAGYRLGTAAEWKGVFTYNTLTPVGTNTALGMAFTKTTGIKIGDTMMLPSNYFYDVSTGKYKTQVDNIIIEYEAAIHFENSSYYVYGKMKNSSTISTGPNSGIVFSSAEPVRCISIN
ncbi:hypothetical protein [Flavobacterium sp. ov086]|uniref:hypothetical protein n=1 Tax=Flavobacterium sp. ov086 TaxID=1761785 RepID=UPI000B6F6ED9|nr:hypothetical protein [Flavobacterium sp. ov086]SNR67657.1 hypothetical protein SAMN04487979_11650 [Flavobacterium sp. ov086]